MTRFDEKDYWRGRHDDHQGQYKAVGIDNIPERANQLAYRQLVQQYERLLDRLNLPAGTPALDAGAGIGAFTHLLYNRGFDLTALDISQTALDGIDLPIKKICSPIADAELPERAFQYVHSFDVLYHIMDDAEWAASLAALARSSSRYVVLHERFTWLPQWAPSKIMKMRSRGRTASVLRAEGFREFATVPSYFVTKHLLTYRLSALAPQPFYRVDDWVLNRGSGSRVIQGLASHRIKAFERS